MKRLVPPLLVLLAPARGGAPGAAAAKAEPRALRNRAWKRSSQLRHPRGLNRFVRAVSDPASAALPRVRERSSTLVERFGASPQEAQAGRCAGSRARGLHGTVAPTGTFVTAGSSPRAARRALLPADGAVRRRLRRGRGSTPASPPACAAPSPASPCSAPSRGDHDHVAVRDAADPARREPRPRRTAYSSVTAPQRHRGRLPGRQHRRPRRPLLDPFTPNQYLTAYGHAALHARGLQGQGQTVAVVEIDGFRHSDIATFDKCFGVQDAADPGRPGAAADQTAAARRRDHARPRDALGRGAEAGPDPRLRGQPKPPGGDRPRPPASALGSPGHRPDVISISLGICEPELPGSLALRGVYDDIFAIAAGAGISTLVSAGDTGLQRLPHRQPEAKKRRRCRCARSACPPAPPT